MKTEQHAWWIQAKGSKSGTTSSSATLVSETLSEDNFRKMLYWLDQLHSPPTAHITHSIVVVVPRKLKSDECENFQSMVKGVLDTRSQSAAKIGNVIVVDDLNDFVPPIAHKMIFRGMDMLTS